ncbi:hypothetical protein NW762_006170 [Fusarium torreyae]|uniref:Major facilitator superfamily (MFS) profile domain-containing protein n=1 Tax=Fusarium torreyae TaxID=1237075 RepID=A0A9W8RZX9_9HYPO|nr:hypothetical protein NW762_006170 [Fusarium torreyae]
MDSRPPSRDEVKPGFQQVEAVNMPLQEPGSERPFWQILKDHPRVLLFTLMANSGALLFGFDVLVQGAITALPAFVISFGSPFGETIILPALWQGLWQAINAMGIMLGAFSNGALLDLWGRRAMFFTGGVISAIACALEFICGDFASVDTRRGVLLAAKFILGVSQGIMMSTCQTYVSEISPPKLRTVLLGCYPFLICVGQMIAISIVFANIGDMTTRAFKIPFAAQWAFSAYAILAALVVPESPSYLVLKKQTSRLDGVLNKLYGSKANLAQIKETLISTIAHEGSVSNDAAGATYSECFKATDLRRTFIVAILNTLQQFMGISLISNSTYFFVMAGMSAKKALTVNQIGVGLSMVGTLVSWLIMTRFGRRMTILSGFATCGVIYLAMAIAGFFPHNPSALNFLGVSVILASLTSNFTVGTAYPVAAAEIPSVRLRAKTLGIGFFVNAFMTWIFTFTVPYMFNSDQGNLGGKIGFIFLATCVIGFAVSWLQIPETKNMSYADIDHLFSTKTECKVRVFGGPEDYNKNLNDGNTTTLGDNVVLVMRGAGPIGYPGAPEVVNMHAPAALLKMGIFDVPCIGDGRQSGTSGSPSILHASPETSAGRNLAILRNGDTLKFDLDHGLLISLYPKKRYRAEGL